MLFAKCEEDWNVFKNYDKLKFWKLGFNSQPLVCKSRGEVGFTEENSETWGTRTRIIYFQMRKYSRVPAILVFRKFRNDSFIIRVIKKSLGRGQKMKVSEDLIAKWYIVTLIHWYIVGILEEPRTNTLWYTVLIFSTDIYCSLLERYDLYHYFATGHGYRIVIKFMK